MTDKWKDGQMDGHTEKIMLLLHTFTKFGRILTSGFGGDSARDGQMGGAVTISPSIFSSPELL